MEILNACSQSSEVILFIAAWKLLIFQKRKTLKTVFNFKPEEPRVIFLFGWENIFKYCDLYGHNERVLRMKV